MDVSLRVDVTDGLSDHFHDHSCCLFGQFSKLFYILVKRTVHQLLNNIYIVFCLKFVYKSNYISVSEIHHYFGFSQCIQSLNFVTQGYFDLFNCYLFFCFLVLSNNDTSKCTKTNCLADFIQMLTLMTLFD